jgi:hypothetical protein
MSSPFETVMKLVTVGLTLLMIYLIVAGSVTLAYYTRIGQGTVDGFWYQDRQKWIPKKWINWAGYPGTFSNVANVKVANMTLLKTVKTSSVKTCMLQCDGENSRTETKCVGFMFNTAQCSLASSMTGIYSDASSTGVVYLVNGPDADVKQFYETAGKAPTTAGYSVKNRSLEHCYSNCASNVECNGFTFTGTACGLYSNMDDTTFVSTTGVKSYALKDHTELTPANDVKYWKS